MKKQNLILSVLSLTILIMMNGCAQKSLVDFKDISEEKYCEKDSDCVVNGCCGCSDELINKKFINCTNAICPTLVCDTMINKGIAVPKCIKNECKLVIKKPFSYMVYKIMKNVY